MSGYQFPFWRPKTMCRLHFFPVTWALPAMLLGLTFSASHAQEAAKPESAKVPVKRVVLFSSGVGYFQHQGQVTGNASVDLKFRIEDVNDLLKSMVLEDLGGGQ